MAEESTKIVNRDPPEVDEARAALVKAHQDEIISAKEHWKDRFDQMRANQRFARGKQWPGQTANDDRYVANITHRHLQQRKANLYAKNPRIVAKPRPRMEFQIWDGDQGTLEAAMASVTPQVDPATGAAMPMAPPSEGALALLADVQQAKDKRALLKRIGKTLEIVYNYQLSEPRPKFKPQAKQAVGRTLTNGVAYCKIGYQRIMGGHRPGWTSSVSDFSKRIADLERLAADVADGEIFEGQAQMEELRLKLQALQAEPEIILREGIVFSFPASTAIIVDQECTQLRSFVGANWIVEEYCFTPEKIQEIFGVDVKGSYTKYNEKGKKTRSDKGKALAIVWERYDIIGQTVEYLCEGYKDFLQEPGPVDVKFEQVHPYFALVFNEIEDEEDIYPESNVDIIRSTQREINSTEERKREHRIGARPATVGAQGLLGKDDKDKLGTHATFEHIELAIPPSVDVKTVIQPKPTVPYDPNLYETDSLFANVLRTTGDAEANFGGTAGDTATESTIAENTRMSTIESNKDDLDEWLTEIAQAAGQILLSEMSAETAKKIAGVGAAWPEMTRSEIAEEIILEIAAGSSGRPNRALDIANFERLAPIAIQIPGLNPAPMAKRAAVLLDQEAELEEWVLEGMPSITQLNAVKQVAPGGPDEDPNQQGREGQNNAPRGPQSQPGPQPQFPLQ